MNELPPLSPEAAAQSEQLTAAIARMIQRNGPLPLATFMQQALYHPTLGYYRGGAQKWGVGGDFVTAPELSPLFSWSVARQVAEVLHVVPTPCILELGAGSGVMALEILRALEREHVFLETYYILDVSAELCHRQRKRFEREAPQYLDKIVWLDQLPDTPICGVILANEVLDAMPVHKIKIENGVREFFVNYVDAQFCWELQAPGRELLSAVEALDFALPQGYHTELNLWVTPWIQSLADCLQQGLMLLIDYGYVRAEYFHVERSMGTLMCHYQHRAHDNPLIFPGVQDITAHVDFTAVALAADAARLTVAGFTHQAAFLVANGLLEFYEKAEDTYAAAQQVKRLTLPSEMGERFKVMALTRGIDFDLCGFQVVDQRHKL